MKQSRLTIRTLGLAALALTMACVHAAMGDGRSGITTIKGTSARAGGGGRASSEVATIKGDPWQFSDTRLASAQPSAKAPQSQAARNAANRYRQDRAKARAAHGTGGAKTESVCIVRRAGDPSPLRPPAPAKTEPVVAKAEPATAESAKPAVAQTVTRNAFALTPIMTQSAR